MSFLLRLVALVSFLLVCLWSVGVIDQWSSNDALGFIALGLASVVVATMLERPIQP